jgi:hypothetical protein
VDRPTICQTVRMGRLYSPNSEPNVSLEENATFIFIENILYAGGRFKKLVLHKIFSNCKGKRLFLKQKSIG